MLLPVWGCRWFRDESFARIIRYEFQIVFTDGYHRENTASLPGPYAPDGLNHLSFVALIEGFRSRYLVIHLL